MTTAAMGLDGLRQLFGLPVARQRGRLGPSLGPAPNVWWLVSLPTGQTVRLLARTRSEARAGVKRQLGLRQRLPVGTVVQRLG